MDMEFRLNDILFTKCEKEDADFVISDGERNIFLKDAKKKNASNHHRTSIVDWMLNKSVCREADYYKNLPNNKKKLLDSVKFISVFPDTEARLVPVQILRDIEQVAVFFHIEGLRFKSIYSENYEIYQYNDDSEVLFLDDSIKIEGNAKIEHWRYEPTFAEAAYNAMYGKLRQASFFAKDRGCYMKGNGAFKKAKIVITSDPFHKAIDVYVGKKTIEANREEIAFCIGDKASVTSPVPLFVY